jgi:phosphatidylglycerophosphatase C
VYAAVIPVNLSTGELVKMLEPLLRTTPSGLFAFDADGTLWSGDVGEDVFKLAVEQRLLRDEARAALAREASSHAIDPSGSASAIAARLSAAHFAGTYAERDAYAMMTWCYAGFTLEELTLLAQRAFAETRLGERLHAELAPILALARKARIPVAVVSASPLPIVREAVRLWDIDADAVTATRAAVASGRLLDRLAAPVPYAEAKVTALEALFPKHVLLASFGDSAFDLELLRAARVGVAVRPKPALAARLEELASIATLDWEDGEDTRSPLRGC